MSDKEDQVRSMLDDGSRRKEKVLRSIECRGATVGPVYMAGGRGGCLAH